MEPVKFSEKPLRISTWRLKCAVFDCNSKKSENSLISLHKLPAPNKQSVYITDSFGNKKQIDRLEAWKSALKLENIYNSSRVCSLHFTKEDYHYYLPDMPAAKRKLKQYAVPSCNLPGRKFNKEKIKKRRARHERIIARDKNKESMKKKKDQMEFHKSKDSAELGEPVSCFTDVIQEANMSIGVNETTNVPTDLLTELQLTKTFLSLPVEVQQVMSEKSDCEINQYEDCEPIEPVSESIFQNSDLETQEFFFQSVRFPSDIVKQNEWIKNVNSSAWAPNKNDRICSRHFEEKFFRRSGSKICLLNQAVPTIFPPYPFYVQPKVVYKRSRSVRIRSGSPDSNEPGTSGIIQENAPDSSRKKKLKIKSYHSEDAQPKRNRRNCMVLFCKNKYSTPEITYFSLTKKRHDPWMRALGRDPSKEILRQSNVVCSEHFVKEDMEVLGNKKKLREGAVPKLNLGLKNPHMLLCWKKLDYSCKVPYEKNMDIAAEMVEEPGLESELVVGIKTESKDLCMSNIKIERDEDVENKLEIVSNAIKEEPDDYIDNGENYMYNVKIKNGIVEPEIKTEITSADEDNSPEIKTEELILKSE